jgi:hypothetical protein
MAKHTGTKSSIIGAIGGVLIGAAILMFVCTLVLNSLKASMYPHTGTAGGVTAAQRTDWNATNSSIEQLKTFLTVCTILLGILGIVLIGASIISAIGGGFGGGAGE